MVEGRAGLLLGGADVGDADGFSCTRAMRPSRTDVSMFFELGVHWGR